MICPICATLATPICPKPQVNGDGSEAERGRTRPISGSLNPVWKNPPEIFILTAVEEVVLEVSEGGNAATRADACYDLR